MKRSMLLCLILAVVGLPLCVGCNPKINGFDQATGVQRRTAVQVYGENLVAAGVEFDGVMVGSWVVSPPPGEKGARRTVVPLDQVPPGNEDTVTARKGSSSDSATLAIDVAAPAPIPSPSFDVSVPGIPADDNATYGFQEAVTVTVVGAGFYPGRATLANRDAGPEARAVGGTTIPALGTKMLGEHRLLVYFPRTMPADSYKVELRNDSAYEPGATWVSTPNAFVRN